MSSWFFVIFGLQLLLVSCNAESHSVKSKNALVEGILQKLLNLTTSSFTYAPTKVREKIINIIEQKLKRSAKTLGTPNSEKYIALIMDAIRSIKSDKDIIHETPSEEHYSRSDETLRTKKNKSHKKSDKDIIHETPSEEHKETLRSKKNKKKKDKKIKHVARNNLKSSEVKHKTKKKHHSEKQENPFTRQGLKNLFMKKLMKEKKYDEESNEITPKEVQFAYVNNIDVKTELQEPIRPRSYFGTKNTGGNEKFDYDIRQNKYGENINTLTNRANDGTTVVKHFRHSIKPYSNVTFASPCYNENINVCKKIQDLKFLECQDHSKIQVEKLCDNFKDCSDYTDEVDCAKHGVNKVRDTSRIMSDLLHSFSENCYTFDVEELFVEMQTQIWTNVVENQFEILEEHAKQYAKTDERKFRVESENLRKTVNEVAVTVSSMSSALTKLICSNEPRSHAARKSNDLEVEEPFSNENNTSNNETVLMLPRTCNCTDTYCTDLLCPPECETICLHRYNLGRLQCNANGLETSVSLDLICDGKSDCHDDEDESRCLIVPGLSLFESNNMYKYVLDIITTKMKSVYFLSIRSSLLDLQKAIKQLQAATSKRDVSRLEVKNLRKQCFSQILGIYDKTKSYARSIIEMIDIYIFLLAVNEKLVLAMKLSHTGNVRTTDPDECMCNNNKCLYSTCSEPCTRACSAETKLKRYHCGESLYSNKTIAITALCDGKFDCPDQDDERGCSKDICLHHHLVSLRQKIQETADTGENMTSLGEELKAWAEKILTTLLMPGKERLNPRSLQKTVAKALHDLLKTYAEILPSRKRSDVDIIENFYKMSLVIMKGLKSCGK